MKPNTKQPPRNQDDTPFTPAEMRIINALTACPESRLYNAGKPLSFQQIGRLMGVSRQCVHFLEARALNKLRYRLSAEMSELTRSLRRKTSPPRA